MKKMDPSVWLLVLPALLTLYIILSVFFDKGIFNTYLAHDFHDAGGGWHILGFVLLIVTCVIGIKMDGSTVGKWLLMFLTFVLAICAFAGFNFAYA